MEKVRKAAGLYFLIQGLGVVAWWILLIAWPESRLLFVLEPNRETSLLAFWLPDLLLIGPGSFLAALLIFSRRKYAEHLMWLVTGAVTYATLYTSAMAMITDRGWLGVLMMVPAMLWSGVFAMALTVGGDMFRSAKSTSTNYVLIKTFSQIAVVWSLILVVFPYFITVVEDKLGIPRLDFAFQQPIAVVLFILISCVGVWAATTMSRIGKGTPLPLDHATALVVRGPYAFVRNPMAVSGVGQGLAVALFLSSPLVALYALMGSLIWQLIFRPLEEDDLQARFGDPYGEYCTAIKCWVPNVKPYQIDGTAVSSNSIDLPSGRM